MPLTSATETEIKTMHSYKQARKGQISPETRPQPSCPYSLRARMEKPLKRKRVDALHQDPEPQLMERAKKRRRNDEKENTGTRPVKESNSLQKAGSLSPETQPTTSSSYSLRARKENPLKRKRMDPESQPLESPKKRRTTQPEENTGTSPVKRCSALKKEGMLLPETQPEPSCSSSLRANKENPLKRKRVGALNEEEKPKKMRRTETVKNSKKSSNSCSSSDSELSASDDLYKRLDLQTEKLPEDFTERFTIGELLGKGYSATVFEGVRKSDGQKVAIKCLLKEMTECFTPPGETCSIPREVVCMQLVSKSFPSPFVIKLLEWFETPNGFLLIMERPPNSITLDTFCNRLQGRVPEETARIIMWQVIQAVRHCWKRGVVHRDIKERNILVNPETLEVKLIDFGLTYIPWDVIFKFKGRSVFLPIPWIHSPSSYEPVPEFSAIGDLGSLLYFMICGTRPCFETPPFSIKGVSEACSNVINWCMHSTTRPMFIHILEHEWFKGLKLPFKKRKRRRRR